MISVRAPSLQPWLAPVLAQFWGSHFNAQGDSLPQTIGVNDSHGAGGTAFALNLAHALLCLEPTAQGTACGHCAQCRLLQAGNHTDLMLLTPEVMQLDFVPEKEKKPSKDIKIDQVRAIESQFYLSAQRGGRKVVLVYPAEQLGTVPANALLKTLEEPPAHTYFLIVSAHWGQVLPTIRSRCVSVSLPSPSAEDKMNWLKEQGVAHPQRWLEVAAGRADKALDMAQDPLWLPLLKSTAQLAYGSRCNPLELAQLYAKAELKRVIELLSLWMIDVLTVAQAGKAHFFAPSQAALEQLVLTINQELAVDFQHQLAQLAVIAEHPLNPRSQCEALLLRYCNLFKS